MFLWSKNYVVCTGASKWSVNLVNISQPSAAGDVHSAEMFIPETIGYDWVNTVSRWFVRVLSTIKLNYGSC